MYKLFPPFPISPDVSLLLTDVDHDVATTTGGRTASTAASVGTDVSVTKTTGNASAPREPHGAAPRVLRVSIPPKQLDSQSERKNIIDEQYL